MGLNLQKIPFIRFPTLPEYVNVVINDVLQNDTYFNGKYTELFIESFTSYLATKNCIPTGNCTDALEIILRAKNIGPGDEVIVPAFTWFSDASVVQLVGAKIVFAAIELDHFGISLVDLTVKITLATKAVIVPHLFGVTHPQIQEIKSLCIKFNILLIEDCAQAHGSTLNGQLAGTFGDVAAFSFYPTKNLGALGDAGAILTNDNDLAIKCSLWANHGQESRNLHQQIGRNSRMDELQAAILYAKLPYLEDENQKRRKIAQIYFREFKNLPIVLPVDYLGHVYHQFVIMTDERDELKSFLYENNIETDIHYPHALVSMHPFKTQNSSNFRNALKAASTVLSLPIHPNHNLKDIQIVAEQIQSFFKQ